MLRNISLEDAKDLYEIFSDEVSTRYWLGRVSSLEEMNRLLKVAYLSYMRKGLPCPQVLIKENKVIGLCAFNEAFDGIGRIEFILHRDYEHQGMMYEALCEMIERGFNEYGYHRIEALLFCENEKSKAVLKRCGFMFEGTMRNYLDYDNQLWDIDLWSRIKEDK